jgi:hypothetical protein
MRLCIAFAAVLCLVGVVEGVLDGASFHHAHASKQKHHKVGMALVRSLMERATIAEGSAHMREHAKGFLENATQIMMDAEEEKWGYDSIDIIAKGEHPRGPVTFVVDQIIIRRPEARVAELEIHLVLPRIPFIVQMVADAVDYYDDDKVKKATTSIELWAYTRHEDYTTIIVKYDEGTRNFEMEIRNLNLRLFRYDQTGLLWPTLFSMYGVQDATIKLARTPTPDSEQLVVLMKRFAMRFSYEEQDQKPLILSAPNNMAGTPIEFSITSRAIHIKSPEQIKGRYKIGPIYKAFSLEEMLLSKHPRDPTKAVLDMDKAKIGVVRDSKSLYTRIVARATAPETYTKIDGATARSKHNIGECNDVDHCKSLCSSHPRCYGFTFPISGSGKGMLKTEWLGKKKRSSDETDLYRRESFETWVRPTSLSSTKRGMLGKLGDKISGAFDTPLDLLVGQFLPGLLMLCDLIAPLTQTQAESMGAHVVSLQDVVVGEDETLLPRILIRMAGAKLDLEPTLVKGEVTVSTSEVGTERQKTLNKVSCKRKKTSIFGSLGKKLSRSKSKPSKRSSQSLSSDSDDDSVEDDVCQQVDQQENWVRVHDEFTYACVLHVPAQVIKVRSLVNPDTRISTDIASFDLKQNLDRVGVVYEGTNDLVHLNIDHTSLQALVKSASLSVEKLLPCSQDPTHCGYRGKQSKTKGGKTCQSWVCYEGDHCKGDSVEFMNTVKGNPSYYARLYDLGDHNYCRNPGSPSGVTVTTIWCFDEDGNAAECAPLVPPQSSQTESFFQLDKVKGTVIYNTVSGKILGALQAPEDLLVAVPETNSFSRILIAPKSEDESDGDVFVLFSDSGGAQGVALSSSKTEVAGNIDATVTYERGVWKPSPDAKFRHIYTADDLSFATTVTYDPLILEGIFAVPNKFTLEKQLPLAVDPVTYTVDETIPINFKYVSGRDLSVLVDLQESRLISTETMDEDTKVVSDLVQSDKAYMRVGYAFDTERVKIVFRSPPKMVWDSSISMKGSELVPLSTIEIEGKHSRSKGRILLPKDVSIKDSISLIMDDNIALMYTTTSQWTKLGLTARFPQVYTIDQGKDSQKIITVKVPEDPVEALADYEYVPCLMALTHC